MQGCKYKWEGVRGGRTTSILGLCPFLRGREILNFMLVALTQEKTSSYTTRNTVMLDYVFILFGIILICY